MLKCTQPYVTFGYSSLKPMKELINIAKNCPNKFYNPGHALTLSVGTRGTPHFHSSKNNPDHGTK
eukprot:4520298-Heterocapsa_arctica.AAC.1